MAIFLAQVPPTRARHGIMEPLASTLSRCLPRWFDLSRVLLLLYEERLSCPHISLVFCRFHKVSVFVCRVWDGNSATHGLFVDDSKNVGLVLESYKKRLSLCIWQPPIPSTATYIPGNWIGRCNSKHQSCPSKQTMYWIVPRCRFVFGHRASLPCSPSLSQIARRKFSQAQWSMPEEKGGQESSKSFKFMGQADLFLIF